MLDRIRAWSCCRLRPPGEGQTCFRAALRMLRSCTLLPFFTPLPDEAVSDGAISTTAFPLTIAVIFSSLMPRNIFAAFRYSLNSSGPMFAVSFFSKPNIRTVRWPAFIATNALAPPLEPSPSRASRYLKTPPSKSASQAPLTASQRASSSIPKRRANRMNGFDANTRNVLGALAVTHEV